MIEDDPRFTAFLDVETDKRSNKTRSDELRSRPADKSFHCTELPAPSVQFAVATKGMLRWLFIIMGQAIIDLNPGAKMQIKQVSESPTSMAYIMS